jgi:adenylate kinase
MRVPVLLITGPVGVGKTAVLNEAAEILRTTEVRFTAVDLDALSYTFPAPRDDRFRSELTFRNLAALWRNARAAGSERLVLARVIEARAEVTRYGRAIPGADITVVRLRAPIRTLQRRAREREIGLGRAWSVKRAAELARIMDRARPEDILVETDRRTVGAIAREILDRVGWLPRATRRAPARRSGRMDPSGSAPSSPGHRRRPIGSIRLDVPPRRRGITSPRPTGW